MATGEAARALVTLAILGACASSCGSSEARLKSGRVERAVAAAIKREHSISAAVSCPRTIPRRAGYSFTCLAHLDAGVYPVAVTVTDSAGRMRFESRKPLTVLDSDQVQTAIVTSIARQRRLAATVTCPTEVLQQIHLSFYCSAKVMGSNRKYPFKVTEVNTRGRVRYVGLDLAATAG